MQTKSIPVLWMGAAFAVAVVLAAAVLGMRGTDTKAIGAALGLTARWSFLLFWLAYAGRSLAELFGSPLAPLARRGREFGLAFAAAHLVHLGLVVWLYRIAPEPPLSPHLFVFFSIGIAWTYLLAILSFGGLSRALGPKLWRLLRFLGMNYILLAFARDFVPVALHPPTGPHEVARLLQYAPFAALSMAAPVLVLAAAAQRRWMPRQAAA